MLIQITEPNQKGPKNKDSSENMVTAIGIDLGTTNSVISYVNDNHVEVLENPNGDRLIPSLVAYDQGKPVAYGNQASDLLFDQPDKVVSSIKRLMGKGAKDIKNQEIYGHLSLVSEEEGQVKLMVGECEKTPVEISSDILNYLKLQAEATLGHAVKQAVITVPAYFDEGARQATKDAAKLAGIDVLRLLNEPTAAALAYGLDEKAKGCYLVYDLGGGTFDVSLLSLQEGIFRVLATGGNNQLGGDDFDHQILVYLVEQFLKINIEDLKSHEHKLLLRYARSIKEYLSNQDLFESDLIFRDHEFKISINKETIESLIQSLIATTIDICRDVLEEGKVKSSDLTGLIMVGGSTRVPVVQNQLTSVFSVPLFNQINPDEVVAKGAGLQAKALTVGSDTLLLDVTPLSLGLETMGGLVERIIDRNSPIPVAKAQDFTTYQDGQTAMSIHVVQGEREMVDQCRSLAKFAIKNIPPMVAGAAKVRITFQLDADGLLTVTAEEKTTGQITEVSVKPTYGLDEKEMRQMLEDSMIHAKEDMRLRLLNQARVEANRFLNALKIALEKDANLIEESYVREIQEAIHSLESKCEEDDHGAIDDQVKVLDKLTQKFAQKRMNHSFAKNLTGIEVDALSKKMDEL